MGIWNFNALLREVSGGFLLTSSGVYLLKPPIRTMVSASPLRSSFTFLTKVAGDRGITASPVKRDSSRQASVDVTAIYGISFLGGGKWWPFRESSCSSLEGNCRSHVDRAPQMKRRLGSFNLNARSNLKSEINLLLGGAILMSMNKEQFVVDENGNRTAVLLGVERYFELLEAHEELESIRAYDAAKSSGDEVIPFSQAVKEIEGARE
ncbi:MAG: hypothetical protein ACR2G5_03745 [Pyrinomonadaceae bacterium]